MLNLPQPRKCASNFSTLSCVAGRKKHADAALPDPIPFRGIHQHAVDDLVVEVEQLPKMYP